MNDNDFSLRSFRIDLQHVTVTVHCYVWQTRNAHNEPWQLTSLLCFFSLFARSQLPCWCNVKHVKNTHRNENSKDMRNKKWSPPCANCHLLSQKIRQIPCSELWDMKQNMIVAICHVPMCCKCNFQAISVYSTEHVHNNYTWYTDNWQSC